jgi:hypothetical protein
MRATVPGQGDLLRGETSTPERPDADHMEQFIGLQHAIVNQLDMLHQVLDPQWARERMKRWLGEEKR